MQEGSIASDPITITVGGKSHYHRSKVANPRSETKIKDQNNMPLKRYFKKYPSIERHSKSRKNWIKIANLLQNPKFSKKICR